MYEYIRGQYIGPVEGGIVVENGGIGYRLQWVGALGYNAGETVQVYTHLHVREDAQLLYGFASPEVRQIFLLLVSVSGVGPKLAQQVLTSLEPAQFARAVVTGDITALTRAKGLGKKGAEKIVVELRDKMKKEVALAQALPQTKPGAVPTADTDWGEATDEALDPKAMPKALEEIVEALLVLGFPLQEAKRRVTLAYDPEAAIEDNIRAALQGLDRRS